MSNDFFHFFFKLSLTPTQKQQLKEQESQHQIILSEHAKQRETIEDYESTFITLDKYFDDLGTPSLYLQLALIIPACLMLCLLNFLA